MISPFFRRLISAVLPRSRIDRTARITSSGKFFHLPPDASEPGANLHFYLIPPRSYENNLCVLCTSLPRFYVRPGYGTYRGEYRRCRCCLRPAVAAGLVHQNNIDCRRRSRSCCGSRGKRIESLPDSTPRQGRQCSVASVILCDAQCSRVRRGTSGTARHQSAYDQQ